MNELPDFEFDRSCARLASALTAYFDGEATPAESRTAREHLRACQSCAALLDEWGSTRAILQSAPVPTPPPGFLLRLLAVCRLAALRDVPQKTPAARSAKPLSAEQVTARLNLQSFNNFRDEWNDENKAKQDVDAPEFLLDAICLATTRAEIDQHAAPTPTFAPVATPEFAPSPRRADATRWHRAPRIAAAYAVPALLLLMVWSDGRDKTVVPNDVAPVATETAQALQPRAATRRIAKRSTPVAKTIRTIAPVEKIARVAMPLGAARRDETPVRDASFEFAETPMPRFERPVFRPANFLRAERNRTAEFRMARDESAETVNAAPPAAKLIATPRVETPSVAAPRTSIRVATRDSARARLVNIAAARRSAPRLLTPVSFAPAALRSHRAAPVIARETSDAAANEEYDDFEDKPEAVAAVDSYRAALAEDIDEDEITS